MTDFFTSPIDKSLGTTGSWQDIDLSGDIPSGASGAIFEVLNEHVSLGKDFGLRKKGSTDNRHNDIDVVSHLFVITGVDANRECQGYIESTDVDFKLMGYTESDVTMFTNAVEKTPGVIETWVDFDLSSELPAGSVAAIFEIVAGEHYEHAYMLRKKGSTDVIPGEIKIHTHCYGIVGVDGNRVCQIQKLYIGYNFYLCGYLSKGFAYTNAVNRTPGSTGSYVDVTESDADPLAKGVFGFVDAVQIDGFAARENGTSYDYYKDSEHAGFFVGIDANKKWEVKIENWYNDIFVQGYFGLIEPPPPPPPSAGELQIKMDVGPHPRSRISFGRRSKLGMKL